jgi:2-furoate---CoA ligase
MPLYHTMGVRSLLAMALVDGCFVCLPRFDPAAALGLIARERVSNLYLVPTLYHDLVGNLDFAATDVSSVAKLGFAGAAMPEGLLKRIDAAFKPQLFVNHYGSSEIYTFTTEPAAAAKPGSAGRAGLNQRIRVVRLGAAGPDDRAAVGEEGEIIADVDSDEAFEGYWNRPDADARALRQGWYFTGDTGYVDAAGDLFATGRVDDMIVTGGALGPGGYGLCEAPRRRRCGGARRLVPRLLARGLQAPARVCLCRGDPEIAGRQNPAPPADRRRRPQGVSDDASVRRVPR